jgi:hypothetical protein
VCCLNHLVSNAMTHATESLEYMARLRDPQVFRFCAIPQVMAIATLSACYDNPKVFQAVVKIPRSMRHDFGIACRLCTAGPLADPLALVQRAHHGDHQDDGGCGCVLPPARAPAGAQGTFWIAVAAWEAARSAC